MTIDINELRLLVQDYKLAGSPVFVQAADMNELLDHLEAAEKGRDALLEALETLSKMAEAFPSELHEKHPDVIAAREG